MTFSKQFRALIRLAGILAIPWTILGVVVAGVRWITRPDLASTVPSLAGWILNHAIAYGALGLLSGVYLGLLLARIEHGRRVEEVSLRRMALWSGAAGAFPPVLFAGLGLVFGAPGTVYLPLLGLGLFSAVLSGGLATSSLAAAQRRTLPQPDHRPTLGAP